MIQIRYTSILLWSVHDKAARAAHLPVRRPSSLLPRVLAGRGNLLASLLPPVLEDLAPCGRPLTNPEARRSLPVPVGPPGGAPQATLRVGLHDKSATPALGLSANDAPRARETGTCARREVGVSQQKGKCDRTSRGHRGLSLSLFRTTRATREGGVASGNKARRQHSGLLTASEGSVRGAADGRSLSSPLFRPTSSALRCRSRSIDRERESARFETVELTRSECGSSGPAVSPHGVRPRARATRNSSGHEPGLRVGRRRSHHHALHDGSAPSKVALHHLRSAPLFRSCPFRLTCGEPTVWIRRHP